MGIYSSKMKSFYLFAKRINRNDDKLTHSADLVGDKWPTFYLAIVFKVYLMLIQCFWTYPVQQWSSFGRGKYFLSIGEDNHLVNQVG